MEATGLKRKNRSPSNNNNAFATPRSKKQRTKSPKPNSSSHNSNNNKRNFRTEIHENKYNVSCSYFYNKNGTIPIKDSLNNSHKCKRIEIRIPISLLSIQNNTNILDRLLWGGGHINNNLYTSDSDIVCILYHLGIINKFSSIDPFSLLNKSLSQNMNYNSFTNIINENDYNFMYVRTSNHKLNNFEIKQEQNRNLTSDKLYEILGNNDMIGIAVIFDIIFKKRDIYYCVNKNGYYSRQWNNKNNQIKTSLKLKYVYPLINFNQFVIDNKYLFPMYINTQIQNKTNNYKSLNLTKKMDIIGFEINNDNRPCLKYNISVISNANLLINQIDWKNEQDENVNDINHKMRERDNNNNNNNNNNKNNKNNNGGDSDADNDSDNDNDNNNHNNHNNHNNNNNNGNDNNNSNNNNNNSDEKRYGHLLQFRLTKYILMMENNKCQYQLIFNIKTNKYKFIKMEFVNNYNQNQRKQRHHNKIADDLNWNDLKWSNKGLTIKNKLYILNKVWLIKK